MEYHTFIAGKRNHAVVIRGLQEDQTLEVISQDLSNNTKIKVVKVFKMKAAAPLFMLVTDDSLTVTKLNREVPVIIKTKISWENKCNVNPISQSRYGVNVTFS